MGLSCPFGDIPGGFLSIAHPLAFEPLSLTTFANVFSSEPEALGYLAPFLRLPAEQLCFFTPPLGCL